MAAGRPTKYQRSYAKQARKLCELGATNEQLADFFEVAVSTVNLWAVKYKEFSDSLKAGRAPADEKVERSLYQRALGYDYDTAKVMAVGGEAVVVPYRERMHADVTAAIFWLKNRRPEQWRAAPEPGDDNSKPAPVSVNINVSDASQRDS